MNKFGVNILIEPKKNNYKDKIVIRGVTYDEVKLQEEMKREEIANKLLDDPEFRNYINNNLSDKAFKYLIYNI